MSSRPVQRDWCRPERTVPSRRRSSSALLGRDGSRGVSLEAPRPDLGPVRLSMGPMAERPRDRRDSRVSRAICAGDARTPGESQDDTLRFHDSFRFACDTLNDATMRVLQRATPTRIPATIQENIEMDFAPTEQPDGLPDGPPAEQPPGQPAYVAAVQPVAPHLPAIAFDGSPAPSSPGPSAWPRSRSGSPRPARRPSRRPLPPMPGRCLLGRTPAPGTRRTAVLRPRPTSPG